MGVLATLRGVLGAELAGAYRHGSAVPGGLRPHSDVDVLAVSSACDAREKRRLADRLRESPGVERPARGVRWSSRSLERARSIYLGEEVERWDDLAPAVAALAAP